MGVRERGEGGCEGEGRGRVGGRGERVGVRERESGPLVDCQWSAGVLPDSDECDLQQLHQHC